MRHEIAGADLLRAARDALVAEIVPGLAGAQRYSALMVANALRMVERELMVDERLRAADRAVEAFAGPAFSADDAPRALGESMRAGRHDGDSGLYRALYARAIEAVEISRPDILTPEELGKTM